MGLQTDTDYKWFVNIGNKVCSNELHIFNCCSDLGGKKGVTWLAWKMKSGGVRLSKLCQDRPKIQTFWRSICYQTYTRLFYLKSPLWQSLSWLSVLSHRVLYLLICSLSASLLAWPLWEQWWGCHVFSFSLMNSSFSASCNVFCMLT